MTSCHSSSDATDVPLREEKHVEKRPLQRVLLRLRFVQRQPRQRDVDVGGRLTRVHSSRLGSDAQDRVEVQIHHRAQGLDEVVGDAFKVKELETGGKGRVGREKRLAERLEKGTIVLAGRGDTSVRSSCGGESSWMCRTTSRSKRRRLTKREKTLGEGS